MKGFYLISFITLCLILITNHRINVGHSKRDMTRANKESGDRILSTQPQLIGGPFTSSSELTEVYFCTSEFPSSNIIYWFILMLEIPICANRNVWPLTKCVSSIYCPKAESIHIYYSTRWVYSFRLPQSFLSLNCTQNCEARIHVKDYTSGNRQGDLHWIGG
jgi:hypothetical protein